MLKNVDDTILWLNTIGLKNWRIKTSDGDNKYIYSSDENKTFEENLSNYKTVMNICKGHKFIIQAYPAAWVSRGIFTDEFSNTENTLFNNQNQSIGVGAVINNDVIEQKINEALNNYKREQEIENLKKENSELREKVNANDTAVNRIIKRADPFIGTLINHLTSKLIGTNKIAIAGTQSEIVKQIINVSKVDYDELKAIRENVKYADKLRNDENFDLLEHYEKINNQNITSMSKRLNLEFDTIVNLIYDFDETVKRLNESSDYEIKFDFMSENKNVENQQNDEQTKLLEALENWRNADSEFVDLIVKISQLAHSKNPMYETAKGLLKNM